MITFNLENKLSTNVLIYYFLKSIISFGVLIVLGFYFISKFPDLTTKPIVPVIFGLFILSIIYRIFWWKMFSYSISEQSISITSGVLFVETKNVNFNDIQSVNSARGPLAAVLGLRWVKGFTSSPEQIIVTSSQNGGSRSTTLPDINLILEKEIAIELAGLINKGDIQKVQNI